MARKGQNVYQRSDGRWEGRYITDYDERTGKARYGYVYANTYKEAKEKKERLEKLKDELWAAERRRQRRVTVKECFREWLALKRSDPRIHRSTVEQYERSVEKHILPELGHYKLYRLSADAIDRFRAEKLERGRLDGGGGLSASAVNAMVRLIYSMLGYVADEGYLAELPRKKTRLAGVKSKKDVRVFSAEEQRRIERVLLDCAGRESIKEVCLGIFFALYTGLRVGELAGLQWRDINLNSGRKPVVRVRRTLQRGAALPESGTRTEIRVGPPKSANSRRSLPMQNSLAAVMRVYYSKLPERRRWPMEPVFAVDGKCVEPRVFQKRLKWVLKAAGVSDAGFHALRHTFATRCIERGMDVQTLCEYLGHSDANITLNIYAHSFSDHKRKCVNRLTFLCAEEAVGGKPPGGL